MGKISQYTRALKAKLSDLFVVASSDNGSLSTKAVTTEQIGDAIITEQTFSGLNGKTPKEAISDNTEAIGDLSDLTTTDKSSLVGAVNSIGKGTYSTTGLTFNNSSLQDGGYYKLGNIVLVNLRIKLTSAFIGGNPVVSGLPVPNSANNMVTFSTNQTTKNPILSTTGQIMLVENLAIDTIVMINGIYLTT